MPGYLQVQSYKIVDNEGALQEALDLFQGFLVDLGFDKLLIKQWLYSFAWSDLQEFGFGGTFGWKTLLIEGKQLQVAPNVNGVSQLSDDPTKSKWLELNLLIRSEEVSISLQDWRYRPDLGKALWQLVCKLASALPEYGAFLTDEATNAEPWYAIMGIGSNPWKFDLAVVPKRLNTLFVNVPHTYKKYEMEQVVAFARSGAWIAFPWTVAHV